MTDERYVLRRSPVQAEDDLHRSAEGPVELHPDPLTAPLACGDSLAGCSTPQDQLDALFEAGRKYRSFKYWDKVRVGSSESHITGQGFNAMKFDPKKPARTIRRNDGNLGMHGTMHWNERRRFSLPEFRRFGSFPDDFTFAGEFDEGIRQIGDCVPPLFMKSIAEHIRSCILLQIGSVDKLVGAAIRRQPPSKVWET